MAIRIPTSDQSKIFIGSQEIGAVYVGANKVWPDAPLDEVVIGTQTWQKKNLAIDDGLGGITANHGDLATYGYLYSKAATIRIQSSLPDGWRLPTKADWAQLLNFVDPIYGESGKKLKEIGYTHWVDDVNPYHGGTDEFGFTALPAGEILFGNYYGPGYEFCAWGVSNGSIENVTYIANNSTSAYLDYPISWFDACSIRLIK